MTTLQLAYRVMRHLDPSDIGALTSTQGAELAGAISSSLAEFYRLGPRNQSRTNAALELWAPQTITLTVETGSPTISGYGFFDRYKGCSILIDGIRNEVVDAATLLDPWAGEAGEKTDCVLYNDAVAFDSRLIERLATDPILYQQQRLIRQLVRTEYDYAPDGGSSGVRNFPWGVHERDWRTGEPLYYSIAETGQSQGAVDNFILRVHPAPDRAMNLRFDIELEPDMISWSQLLNFPVALPMSDAQIEAILIPFVEYELLASSLWNGKDGVNQLIVARYEKAQRHLGLLPRDFAPTQGRKRTRRGF